MKRSMMQVYVNESDKALEFYKNAFNANVLGSYPNEDGLLTHSELDIYGQIFSISELKLAVGELTEESMTGDIPDTGNTMMFCLHFGEGREAVVQEIYESLKDGAKYISPLEKCDYSPLSAHIVDKFGVRWCIFV